ATARRLKLHRRARPAAKRSRSIAISYKSRQAHFDKDGGRAMGAEKRVLIVDDNQQVRRMIRALIEDIVDEFIECEDGSRALGAYWSLRPDWVLMDVEMNEVDGLTAT